MIRTKTIGVLAGSAALLVSSACADLNVTNPNNPDIERALASPADVQSVAVSSLNSWYLASTNGEGAYMGLAVTADVLTANFGNFGMRFNNLEPRIPYENNSAGGDRDVAETPWSDNYAALGAANDALRAFANGIVLDGGQAETDKYKAIALFTQAGSLGNLAWMFDQAFVVDETMDVNAAPPELVPYTEVSAAAQAKWDALIALTAGKNEEYDATVLPLVGTSLTSQTLNQLANTMAARQMVFTARTKAETEALNWGQILAYAEKGISSTAGASGTSFDMVVQGDGGTTWYSLNNAYGNLDSWLRADMRLIHEMDPSQPAKFNGTIVQPNPNPPDARMGTSVTDTEKDYVFLNKTAGQASRGVWMQSPWYHARYKAHNWDSPTGLETPVPYILAAENDLMIAEGLVRTGGDLARAAALINKTRVGRGHLAPATAADGATGLLAKALYERHVELVNTGGIEWYDRRRMDDLQEGTFRHLPIPASQLEALSMPIYTFGGVGKPDMRIAAPNGRIIEFHSAPRARGASSIQRANW